VYIRTRPDNLSFSRRFLLCSLSMPIKPQRRHNLADHPLHQEGPSRKKRRLSHSESSPDNSEGSSSSDSEQDVDPNTEESIQSEPEDVNDDHWETHSDFIVGDRLGSFGRETKSSNSQTIPPSMPDRIVSFSSLGISAHIQSALKSMSIKTPTEIQVACIPPLLAGKYSFVLLESSRY
jgi:ATP-dependent RNA helicase DDX49/DBP8